MVTRVHPFATNGEVIRRLREGRLPRISQERLAEQVGTTRRHMIRLENGEHLPSAALRDRIAEVLGDSAGEIKSSDEDDEEPSMPLNPDEFALLGDLMSRLGATLVVKESA